MEERKEGREGGMNGGKKKRKEDTSVYVSHGSPPLVFMTTSQGMLAPPGAGRGEKGILPRPSEGLPPANLISDFWLLEPLENKSVL